MYCQEMNSMFSNRISDVPKSFIREILKVASDPSIISFAGGLPNRDLFDLAIKENVAFVPGDPFYTNKTGVNAFRLNYTNSDADTIVQGIKRLAECIRILL